MVERIREERIGFVDAAFTAMHLCAQRARDTVRHGFAGTVETENDGGHSHGSEPFVTRMREK